MLDIKVLHVKMHAKAGSISIANATTVQAATDAAARAMMNSNTVLGFRRV